MNFTILYIFQSSYFFLIWKKLENVKFKISSSCNKNLYQVRLYLLLCDFANLLLVWVFQILVGPLKLAAFVAGVWRSSRRCTAALRIFFAGIRVSREHGCLFRLPLWFALNTSHSFGGGTFLGVGTRVFAATIIGVVARLVRRWDVHRGIRRFCRGQEIGGRQIAGVGTRRAARVFDGPVFTLSHLVDVLDQRFCNLANVLLFGWLLFRVLGFCRYGRRGRVSLVLLLLLTSFPLRGVLQLVQTGVVVGVVPLVTFRGPISRWRHARPSWGVGNVWNGIRWVGGGIIVVVIVTVITGIGGWRGGHARHTSNFGVTSLGNTVGIGILRVRSHRQRVYGIQITAVRLITAMSENEDTIFYIL